MFRTSDFVEIVLEKRLENENEKIVLEKGRLIVLVGILVLEVFARNLRSKSVLPQIR